MANFSGQLEKLKTLIIIGPKSEKPSAYSTLLHLQEEFSASISDQTPIQSFAAVSFSLLLSPIVSDIEDEDEEIAALALKCLGFMIYHPVLVAAISGNDANLILNALTNVIITTKIKSVCNLGVWCISIQQIDALYLAANFPSLLRAIVHAIDNPIGSLSTTFEAIQALMKLVTQLKEKMRDTTNVWGPPIYRRLVSPDKRARDMSERCMLKIKSIICPPTLTLSKALVVDMKKRLLPGMKELQNQGLHIQAIQAWGWYIRLLGSYVKKNRQLVNEMLKILEQTFSAVDPQVQIASLVAWESLIDALIPPITEAHETNNQTKTSGVEEGIYKSLKLIMTPLIGIMSSKCDVSVHSSCLSTWCFLLHKLETNVNRPSILKLVWDPILDAVFRIRPDSKNILVSNICLDLLEEFVSTNIRELNDDLDGKISSHFSSKMDQIKWLPWTLDQLDFFIKVIGMLMKQGYTDGALSVFRLVLKGVRYMLKSSKIDYNEVMSSLSTILALIKEIYEGKNSGNWHINGPHSIFHNFVEVVIEELEPSILGSPLYKMSINFDFIDNLRSIGEAKDKNFLGVTFAAYKEMVSPIVYLMLLYLCGVFSSDFSKPGTEFIFDGTQKFIKKVLSSFEPLEILNAFIGLLYKHKKLDNLKMWLAIANGLKVYINEVKDGSFLKPESRSSYCFTMCRFLSYPLVACSCTESEELSIYSLGSKRNSELEHVLEVWNLLYVSVYYCPNVWNSSLNSFGDELLETLNECLGSITKVVESNTELNERNNSQNGDLTFLSGNISICILEQIVKLENSSKDDPDCYNGEQRSHGFGHVLDFVAKFMNLSLVTLEESRPAYLSLVSSVFSALVRFVCCLRYKEDVLSFLQVMSDPLLQWFRYSKFMCKNSNNQLELLWGKIIDSLKNCYPPITFDSTFLSNQSRLFEETLDHPNPSICEPSITFWNSTFAIKANLDYPRSLLPILDKLSREGKIELCKRSFSSIRKCTSKFNAIPKYTVNSMQNMSSKRVELVADKETVLKVKRKRRELTEHQKEVRRAQQGRERDCGGHGPGIRTYTGCDFSQDNDESQDSQDIDLRDTEAILEKLRRKF